MKTTLGAGSLTVDAEATITWSSFGGVTEYFILPISECMIRLNSVAEISISPNVPAILSSISIIFDHSFFVSEAA